MDKDDEEYNAKQSKILDEWLKTIPKKKKREEYVTVLDENLKKDDDEFEENRKIDVTEFDENLKRDDDEFEENYEIYDNATFEENLKRDDPKYYEEFMNNLEELRKELDKDPDFLHKLIRDELTPVKITYDFTFENTDS